MTEDFWANAEVIYTYTRAQALADGVLHDVTALAKEAGFRVPAAMTCNVLAIVNDIDPESGEDVTGRLWDILTMLRLAAARSANDQAWFTVSIAGVDHEMYGQIAPGDAGEPCLTIMLPWED